MGKRIQKSELPRLRKINQRQLIRLAKEELGHTLGADQRGLLLAYCELFLANRYLNRSVLKKNLQTLKLATENLIGRIARVHIGTSAYLNAGKSQKDYLFDSMKVSLPKFHSRIKEILKMLGPERSGPHHDWALNSFVSNLFYFYFEVTEEVPKPRVRVRRPNVFSFIVRCLEFLKSYNRGRALFFSEGSIEKAMRRCLKHEAYLYEERPKIHSKHDLLPPSLHR